MVHATQARGLTNHLTALVTFILKRRSGVAKDIAETVSTNLLLAALGFATGILSARWMGPVGRGELAAIQLWPSALAVVAMIGLPEALVYFSAKHPGKSRTYLLAASLLACVAMLPIAAVGYFLMPHLLPAQPHRIIQAGRMYLLLIPVYGFVGLPHHLLRGVQRYRLWNAIRCVPPFLWLVVLVAAVCLGVKDPVRLTALFLVLQFCTAPFVGWIVWRHSTGRGTPTKEAYSDLIGFGVPSALAGLPRVFNVRLDQIVVASALPSRELGVYMAALAWSGCVPLLSSALATIVSTRIASSTLDSDRRRLFSRGVRSSIWVIGGPVILLGTATPFAIMALFGATFRHAIIPALILIMAAGASAFNAALEEMFRGLGRPGATMWAETATIVVTLPLLLLLLPRIGITGASLASLFGCLSGTALLLIYRRWTSTVVPETVARPGGCGWQPAPVLDSPTVSLRNRTD